MGWRRRLCSILGPSAQRSELDNSLWLAQSEVKVWPTHDLFAAEASNTTQATAEVTTHAKSRMGSTMPALDSDSSPRTVLTSLAGSDLMSLKSALLSL